MSQIPNKYSNEPRTKIPDGYIARPRMVFDFEVSYGADGGVQEIKTMSKLTEIWWARFDPKEGAD